MDFAMDIDKLNLANLVGKVMNEFMEYQISFVKVYRKVKAGNSLKITKPLPKNHISKQKSQNHPKPYWTLSGLPTH